VIERKPPRAARPSAAALKTGANLYAVFRRHVSLERPLSAVSVAAISKETGLSARRIRELARRFRVSPIAESLAPRPRGPKPGTKHAPPAILAAIDQEIEDSFLHRPRPSVREAANQIRSLLIADNGDYRFNRDDVPSARTIERLIGEISEPHLARMTMGSKQRTAYEPHPGEYQSRGFLDLVQMDHSPANVMLVDSVRREALGRPWVTLLIEVWSRCILGFYVSFGDPSIFRCGRAVANALLSKQPLLTSLGIADEYPMHGFFKRLHADHAGSHRAEVFRSACHAYGIDPDVRPRGPAHFGGHIERLIGTMCEKMLLLPGATGGDVTKRDGHDVEAAATMTIEEFERWFVREICRYHHTPHDGLGRIAPAQRWQDGAAEHGALVPLGIDVVQLTRRFLPWVERTITAGGVRIDHRRYWHESFATRLGLKIMIHVDERTIQEVYPQIDEALVSAGVVGSYPHVTKVEWDAAAAEHRRRGTVYQQGGAEAKIARLVYANREEVRDSKIRTRQHRQARKRLEREGVSHAAAPPQSDAAARANWLPLAELGEVEWLKPTNGA
jgi:putative transposase